MTKGLLAPAVAALATLAGCAALEQHRLDYQAALEGWIGATESELVTQFGSPERVERVDGATRVLHWQSSRTGQTVTSQDGGGLTMTLHCDLSFRLVDGSAVSLEWRSSRGWREHPNRKRVDTLNASPCSEDFPADRSGA